MIHFRNDYSAGAHPAVLQALADTNLALTEGYGLDLFCRAAADTIRSLCAAPEADIHFFVGGTIANTVSLSSFLRPYEAIIAADTAHICVHETGAIEHNGHKVIHCPGQDGKVTPEMLEGVLAAHSTIHMVVPRLVYISNTTEIGTVYTRAELEALHTACRAKDLLLYCDGARLASAIACSDTTFADYARCCDAFTIGGTKIGLLFGEALVIANPALQRGFRHCMKQEGAILAKGRLLGVQFSAILKDGLYLELGRHVNDLAQELSRWLQALHIPLLSDSPTNQVFPILPNTVIAALEQDFTFEVQYPADDTHSCIRLVTAWNSTKEDVAALLARLGQLLG